MTGQDPLSTEQSLFLAGTEWAGWRAEMMPGDADVRQYRRLTAPGGATAILMDMTPGAPAAFDAFVRIGTHLRTHGLSAPATLHAVPGARLLLLEDLGPLTLAAAAKVHPETALYAAATEALIAVQSAPPPPDLPVLTPEEGARMLDPLFDWYLPKTAEDTGLRWALTDALDAHAGPTNRLSLRDYFSENLIWRAERHGLDRVGLLDFQDAFTAPAGYDLASLVRDARRDIGPAASDAALALFADRTGTARDAVDRAVAVLSVQRNLRILGIFSRLARRDGKTRYLPMISRVCDHILHDVAHPALGRLRGPVEAALSTAQRP